MGNIKVKGKMQRVAIINDNRVVARAVRYHHGRCRSFPCRIPSGAATYSLNFTLVCDLAEHGAATTRLCIN